MGGNLFETLEAAEGHFTATAFEKAPGSHADAGSWNPDLFERMGAVTGEMHALATQYHPSQTDCYRPSWFEESEGLAERFLPASEHLII